MYHSKIKSSGTLSVFLILLISLVFRFWFSATHVSFGQDIARDDWLISQRIEAKQWLVAYGPKASVGNFYLPPFYYQLHVVASLVSGENPLVMKWLVTFIESLSPVLILLILRKVVSERMAVLVAISYIAATLPLQYGTTAWNPNMIPFFSLVLIYSSIRVLQDKRAAYILSACVAVAIAFQLHYQSAVLLPMLPFLMVLSVRHLGWKKSLPYWLAGVLLAGLLFLPYFVAEISNHWQNTHAIIHYFSQEHALYYERVSKPTYLLTFFPRFFDRVFFGKETFHAFFGIILYVIGSLYILLQIKKSKSMGWLSILFYFISVVLMLRVFKGDKLDYYLSTLFPMPFLLLASVLSMLKQRWLQYGVIACIVFLLGQHVGRWLPYNDFAGLQQTMQFVSEKTSDTSIRLLFHDDDYVNTVFYGLKTFTNITINDSSPIAVDICNTKDQCSWNGLPQSRYSLAYSSAAELKYDAGYTQFSMLSGKVPFTTVVGRLDNPDLKFDTKGFTYQGEQGSDFLLNF